MVLFNPVPSGRLTDRYGPRGAVTGVGNLGFHTGDDIAADEGTPIVAAHDGVIERVWWDTFAGGGAAGGNMVEIRGDDGLLTRYAHMVAKSPFSVGARVVGGQTVIGHVGQTGAANGDHLHFEVLAKGQFVAPWQYVTEAAPAASIKLILEDQMANPIISVPDKNGTLYIGNDRGEFVAYATPKAKNSRAIISKAFLGGPGGDVDTIPALSWQDFLIAKTVWSQMCAGK